MREVAEERTGTPAATRTGTVPDTEYDAVMAEVNDLIEKQGEQLQVTRQIDGQLVERSAANAIEELDQLEDTFERIRLCSSPTRRVA